MTIPSTCYSDIVNDLERVRADSGFDKMTSLPDRVAFLTQLETLASERPGDFGVLIADLDRLKVINDAGGHAAGNFMIISAGNIISSSIRVESEGTGVDPERRAKISGPDTVAARIHGDEFGIILPGVNSPDILEVIRQRVEQDLERGGIDASIDGRVHMQGEAVDTLVHEADLLMLKRKNERKKAVFEALPKHKRVAARLGLLMLHYAGMNPPRQ